MRIAAALCVLLTLGGLALAEPEAMPAQTPEPPAAATIQSQAESLLDTFDLSAWQRVADSMLEPSQSISVRDTILRVIRGERVLDGATALDRILQALFQSVRSNAGLVIQLIVPALLCAILSRMRAAFENDSVSQACQFVGYALVSLIAARFFLTQLSRARSVVDGIASGMQALFPLLLTLLAAVGGTASSAFFQPAVVAASGTMTAMVQRVTLSFALAAALVTILTHISPNVGLTRLRSLLKTVANWSLGICFTVFIGVMAVQGMGAAAFDGVTMRTAKYAIDNFVPIVGGMMADTMDTLIACSLLVKNALGITGLALLAAYCVGPLAQALGAALVFRFCAAVLEPIADGAIVDLLGDFAGSVTMLFTVLLAVSAMFFLLVAQLLLVGNLTVMLR
ncbi:MAG: stage III sporulation protein AE [Oscillospiraceae bacterium]|jgi:stage III sporulation protein AE|nr:stage III sporulation protein AE [Oscillospiraceae bacterium]